MKQQRKKSIRAHIYDVSNLVVACETSYRGKSQRQREKREVREVMDDTLLFSTQKIKDIIERTYKVGDYRHFFIHDKKKIRPISVFPYSDRCVQMLYKGGIEPVILKQVTDDMCAGLPGRGVTANEAKWCVVRKVRNMIKRDNAIWVWQGDISKFYESTRNVIVMRQLERIIKDKVVLSLIREHIMKQKDLAIGDPFSHLIASLVMSPLVRYLKANGATLVNYADDFLCVTKTKEEAYRIKRLAEEYAITHLRLRFKPSQVHRVADHPIYFCGFIFFPNGKVFINNLTKKKYIKSRHKKRSVAAYNGMLLCCNSRHLRKKIEQNDNYRKHHGEKTNTFCRKAA